LSFFVAKLERESVVEEFFSETMKRNSQALVEVKAQLIKKKEAVYWANITDVKLPPIYYFAFLFLAIFFIWGGWAWFIPTGFFGLTYLFFWKGFHVWAFRRGLRKKGYSGKIEVLSLERGISEAFF
jgi:hypothetical protein